MAGFARRVVSAVDKCWVRTLLKVMNYITSVLCLVNFDLCLTNLLLCLVNFDLCLMSLFLCLVNFDLCLTNLLLCLVNFDLC